MSRTLSPTEQKYPAVEREATAIIEAARKWAHYLHGRTFCLVTDQRSVAFMLDPLKQWFSNCGTRTTSGTRRPSR